MVQENICIKILKKILNYPYNANTENVIVRLQGRMANQMFEWAYSKNIKKYTGIQPLFDDSDETQKLFAFNMNFKKFIAPKPIYKTICRKIIPFRDFRNRLSKVWYHLPVIKEEYFCKYQEEMFDVKAPVYIEGFFQSYKYLQNVREELLEDFKLKKTLNRANKEILKRIRETESVSVHFRRTDYLKPRVADIFGYCDTEYYLNGIKIIAEKCGKTPTLFIFSDDINWVINNVKFDYETVYVDVNSGKQGYFDLELMKNCKHNIIANSSFSYWGAWLNENPNKIVIAPKVWMKTAPSTPDLLPPDWIKLGGQK